jgi:hypothetical protein
VNLLMPPRVFLIAGEVIGIQRRDDCLILRPPELQGLERAPEALNMLFRGENQGKLLVQVAPDPTA